MSLFIGQITFIAQNEKVTQARYSIRIKMKNLLKHITVKMDIV